MGQVAQDPEDIHVAHIAQDELSNRRERRLAPSLEGAQARGTHHSGWSLAVDVQRQLGSKGATTATKPSW